MLLTNRTPSVDDVLSYLAVEVPLGIDRVGDGFSAKLLRTD